MSEKASRADTISKPRKLVYIIGRYPELTTTFIEREIDVLQRLGHFEVQAVSLRYPLTPDAISPAHQEIRKQTLYLVPKNWSDFDFLAFVSGNLRFLIRRPLVYFRTLVYLLTQDHPSLKTRLMTVLHFGLGVYAAHLLSGRDFDHLHAHFIDRAVVVALVISRLLDKPYSLTAHANSIFVKRILIREKIVNASFMVTVSEYNKAHFLDTYPGLDPDKIHVLHPWVDLARFTPPSSRSTRDKLRILSVGRLVEKKGHTFLIEACHLLRDRGVDFECRIVGSGPLRPMLEDGVERYDLQERVHLLGGRPQEEVLELLRSWADVFALPCVIAQDGDRDGIPVSLAEAMAMELPVVSTDIVGIGELVRPDAGFLVPSRDPQALAEVLESIYHQPSSTRNEMGRQGRRIVDENFNLIKGTMQLGQLFRQAVV